MAYTGTRYKPIIIGGDNSGSTKSSSILPTSGRYQPRIDNSVPELSDEEKKRLEEQNKIISFPKLPMYKQILPAMWEGAKTMFNKQNVKDTATFLKTPDNYKIAGKAAGSWLDKSSAGIADVLITKPSNYLMGEGWNAKDKFTQERDAELAKRDQEAKDLVKTKAQENLYNISRAVGEQIPYLVGGSLLPTSGVAKGMQGIKGTLARSAVRGGENVAVGAVSDIGQEKSGADILKNMPVNFGVGVGTDLALAGLSKVASAAKTKIAKDIEYKTAASKAKDAFVNGGEIGDVAPKSTNTGTFASKFNKLFTSGRTQLENQGTAGVKLSVLEDTLRQNKKTNIGAAHDELDKALKGLNSKETRLLGKALDGQDVVMTPKVEAAFLPTRKILDDIAARAERDMVKIKLPDGTYAPFTKKENYLPRYFEHKAMSAPENRSANIEKLLKSDPTATVESANIEYDDFLDALKSREDGTIPFDPFSQANLSRKSKSLEHARTSDFVGYNTDAKAAVSRYIEETGNRLANIETFGANDELAVNLIAEAKKKGGDWKTMQEVHDLMAGNKVYKNLAVDSLVRLSYASKLDFAFITNFTQNVNTASKFGVARTLKSMYRTFADYKGSRSLAAKAGVTDAEIFTGQSAGVTMGGFMEKMLSPFAWVEKNNRVTAALAGEDFAKAMAKKLAKNPEAQYAIRQLKGLGVDTDGIIKRGKLTPEDILNARYNAAAKTQFLVDAIDVPPGIKTNIGKFIAQFRSFNFKQTMFLRDEIVKEASKGNIGPMVRLVALGIPVFYAGTQAKNMLIGAKTEKFDANDPNNFLKVASSLPMDVYNAAKKTQEVINRPKSNIAQQLQPGVNLLAGTTASDAMGWANAMIQYDRANTSNANLKKGETPQDKWLEVKRNAASLIPYAGDPIKQARPTDRMLWGLGPQYGKTGLGYPDSTTTMSKMIQAKKDGDQELFDKLAQEYKPNIRAKMIKQAEEGYANPNPLYDKSAEYEVSPDAPKNVLQTAALYGEALLKDPTTALEAMITKERLRKMRGDAAIVERKNLFNMPGEAGTEKEHTLALGLGGTNNPKNLTLMPVAEHEQKTMVDNMLIGLLASGAITSKEADRRAKNWKEEYAKMPKPEPRPEDKMFMGTALQGLSKWRTK